MLYNKDLREQDPAKSGDLVYDMIEFDAVVQVTHAGSSQVTKHPVESGESISDHSIPEPREVTLSDAVVTDFPLLLPGEKQLSAGVSASSFSVTGAVGFATSLAVVEPLAVKAWQKLNQWRQEGRPLVLVDDFETYENMVIQSVSVPRDAAKGSAMVAQIHLVKISIAETMLVNLPKTERAAPKAKKGPKAKAPASTAEQGAGDSAYYVIGGALF